eukprot:329981-Pyramimonas_sp.AAC.1
MQGGSTQAASACGAEGERASRRRGQGSGGWQGGGQAATCTNPEWGCDCGAVGAPHVCGWGTDYEGEETAA